MRHLPRWLPAMVTIGIVLVALADACSNTLQKGTHNEIISQTKP